MRSLPTQPTISIATAAGQISPPHASNGPAPQPTRRSDADGLACPPDGEGLRYAYIAEWERERRQRQLWACELHDTVAQELAAAQMLLASPDETPSAESARDRRLTAQACVQRALEQVRRLISEAEWSPAESPATWEELVHWITDWQAAEQFPVQLSGAEDLPPVSRQLHLAVLRIVQEALRNARRYSGAPGAVVQLSADDHRLRVRIRDTGSGAVPEDLPPHCFGLRGIQHRAEACGGQAQVLALAGEGTSIIVELPLAEDVAAETENRP